FPTARRTLPSTPTLWQPGAPVIPCPRFPMGRKPHDAATLWLHGSKSQAAAPTESSIPAARAPKYPRGLPPALRRPFRDLCATLTARRALTDGDAELVALYVALADRRTRGL